MTLCEGKFLEGRSWLEADSGRIGNLEELDLLLLLFISRSRKSGTWLIWWRNGCGGPLGGVAMVGRVFRKVIKVNDVLRIRLAGR